MSTPRLVRLIEADGTMVEIEGRYHGGIDVLSLERKVAPGVSMVIGSRSMMTYGRLADDPDGVPVFRHVLHRLS